MLKLRTSVSLDIFQIFMQGDYLALPTSMFPSQSWHLCSFQKLLHALLLPRTSSKSWTLCVFKIFEKVIYFSLNSNSMQFQTLQKLEVIYFQA